MLTVDIAKAVPGFSLGVAWEADREVVALFGASGAGKSLTLQCLSGLVRPDRGRIVVDGRTTFDAGSNIDVPPRDRGVGYVFQGYALFPHLTVEDNLAFGLHRHSRRERRRRVGELMERLGLTGLERRKPPTLSGGEQQRVALGRALASEPGLLLLDEPLSALDAPLRRQLRDELALLLRQFARTSVVVTHDVAEAFQLADRIVVYDRGRVVQSAPKAELLSSPASAQVAHLLGVRNVLRGKVESVAPEEIRVRWRGLTITAATRLAQKNHPRAGSEIGFFVRPELVRLIRKDRPNGEHTRRMNAFSGVVIEEVDVGTSYVLLFALDGADAGRVGRHDIEIDVPKVVFDLLDIAHDRHWNVVIQPSAVHLLPI